MAAGDSRRGSTVGVPGGRLAFERAIRYSSLPAPARHLALTIATWADIESGLIPDRFQPAQTTLEEATGLSRGAVFKHSKLLEAEGWLIREGGGGRSKRTKHVLRIPPGAPTSRTEKVSPGDRYQENVSPGEPETCHVTPETSHLVNENVSPGDTKSSCSSEESLGSTSSSPAEPVETEPPADPGVTEGGGGGSLDESRSTAEYIAGALDYRGKVPDRQQRQKLTDLLAAALKSGWTMGGLALYLDLGEARVDSPAAVYAHRLHPDRLPAAEPVPAPLVAAAGVRGPLPTAAEIEAATLEDVFGPDRPADVGAWEEATARARERLTVGVSRGGTDDRVTGWDAVSRKLAGHGPHQPYSDDAWSAPAIAAEVARVPWCGDVECEPVGRLREHIDSNGFKTDHPCEKCHPRMQWG